MHIKKAPKEEAYLTTANKSCDSESNGGPFNRLSQKILLTPELIDTIEFTSPKSYENTVLLTDLYLKKGYSLRRISSELGCSKSTVRTKLKALGISDFSRIAEPNIALSAKIKSLREKGNSYQMIADKFNLWKIETRSGEGKWFAKTAREILILN